MTPEQKELVRRSWALVTPIADTAAALFYERLFQLDPSLRHLFVLADMREQGRKLMQALAFTVKSLDALDQLVPALEAMGRRHVGYGVHDRDYDTVGGALLWTLEQGLGPAFTAETRAAWAAAYEAVAGVMSQAGRTVPTVVPDGTPPGVRPPVTPAAGALRPPPDTPVARALATGPAPA